MVKVLVACVNYPNENERAMQFVHVRNKFYKAQGIDVTVLNFTCKTSYVYENIKVITLNEFYKNKGDFSECILICHAPNIRNHFIFIKKNNKIFKKILFFFHGHEIVNIGKAYPAPYFYLQDNVIKRQLKSLYDIIKLRIWRKYFLKNDTVSPLIFVSNSLKNDFLKYLKIPEVELNNRIYIINNSVGEIFEIENYNCNQPMYDFITIRSNFDSPVYCIDLITEIAYKMPNKSFLLIGKGRYFEYNNKPDNLVIINKQMKQEELINYINLSKVALMPTRRDSQGVMACELATFGIPLITSNLDVCKEMFDSFSNVVLCSENEIKNICKSIKIKINFEKNEKFFSKNTICREVRMIQGE